MPLYEFEEKRPTISQNSFIHPDAVIIGQVTIGERCYVGAGAILRGDYGEIIICDGSNVQENVIIHSEPYSTALIEEDVLIGHSAIVHGPCIVHRNATIGMGAIVCNQCEIDPNSFLAAGSLLPPGHKIPASKLAMGNPAKVVKDVDEQLIKYNEIAIQLYQDLADRCRKGLKLIK